MAVGLDLETGLKVLEIVSIVGAAGAALLRIGAMSAGMQSTLKEQSVIMQFQSDEMADLKNETKKIAGVLTTIATQDLRLNRVEEDLRDMKHGKGFVNPP